MKKHYLLFTFLLCLTATACGSSQRAQEDTAVTLADISSDHRVCSDAVYWEFSYEELQEKADVIARVQVLDELSSANSYTKSDENGLIASFCSARQVQPLEIYKNTIGLDEDQPFLVQEDAAIYLFNGEYYYDSLNDQTPLAKGDTYILYLQKQENALDNTLVIMSGENGTISIDNPDENEAYSEIAEQTLDEYHIQ